ncbi:DUF1189 family protein [Aerococcaceae bacterium zg-BR9]|uniref:DUF1189 family protein n=1 Tax=Aerococcaceae bacterium zg-1292 TaxID=2774330 RepID=UPI004062D5BF|nr:DUF1189 family protein [Aerococcaceae bacterium zg-BR9]MBF6979239.1 DUF1189 family protein [Aerococcaceae bacterium zg-BR22]
MKNIFKFLYKAYREPRLFIQIVAVKFKQIWHIAFAAILLLSISMTILGQPTFNAITKDISDAAKYVPDYTYKQGKLALAEGEKPLYYQSKAFQLVIDDSIESDGTLNKVPIDATKNDMIDPSIFISLYMFKDQTIASIGNNLYRLGNRANGFLTKQVLIDYLMLLTTRKTTVILTQWLTYLVIAFIIYWLQMFVLATLASSINRNLTSPFTFKQRLKLAIAISFLPLIILEAAKLIIPGFIGSFFLLGMTFISLLYYMMHSHTAYVRDLLVEMSKNNLSTIDNLQQDFTELDYLKEEDIKKDIDHANDTRRPSELLTQEEQELLNSLKTMDKTLSEEEKKQADDTDKPS